MKEYLFDLANDKVKDCQRGVTEIKNILAKSMGNLQAYVAYVNDLELCKNQM